jgi:hypothetical protein|tara:strand:+ start:109 stop:351 length:243 start_codon:yes stop_codon:yes gene_type:complete
MTVSAPSGVKRLRLPEPQSGYDRQAEIFNNVAMEEADRSNFKHFEDVDLANNERLILVSPDGTRYSVTVTNAGVLGTTAI